MLCKCGQGVANSETGISSIYCRKCIDNVKRYMIKRDAVEYKGGKCEDCGYSDSLFALQFHHLDPSKKDFEIGRRRYSSVSKIIEELDKCVLLCDICHKRRHMPVNYELYLKAVSTDVERLKSIKRSKHKKIVNHIGTKSKSPRTKWVHIEWPPLENLIERIKSSCFTSVSDELGVSDNAIRKHLRKHGIDPKSIRSIKDNGK